MTKMSGAKGQTFNMMGSTNRRNTKQRRAILDAISSHGGHLTADEIYRLVKRRFPQLSLGTVYRNLRLLAAQGAVRELDFGMAATYFETSKETHYHLICRVCGKIADAELPVEDRLVALARRASRGFQIEEPRLDFIGVCAACQAHPSKVPANKRTLKAR
jgi:Fur family transcriptional regulator, peroxide stress response regulator